MVRAFSSMNVLRFALREAYAGSAATRRSTRSIRPAAMAIAAAPKEKSAPIFAASCTGPGGKATLGDEERDGKADGRDAADDEEVAGPHSRRQPEPEAALREDAEERDPERLADDEPGQHQPGRLAHRRELDPGVGQAEEEEDHLDRASSARARSG